MTDGPIKIGMRPEHPGIFVKEEVFDYYCLSIKNAAEILGVRRATLSDFVNGKASLTPEMAMRLEKAFNLDLESLLRHQAWYDAVMIRDRSAEFSIERYVPADDFIPSGDFAPAD